MIHIAPQAFFFDFDGVIVDSEKVHMLAALESAKTHGMSFSEEYYFRELLGYDDQNLFANLGKKNSQFLDEKTIAKLKQGKNESFMKLIDTNVIYFDGVLSLIEKLTAKKIPLCVVSGAREKEILACLKKGGLEKYFKFIVSTDHVKQSKPDPECYEMAFEKMLDHVPSLKKENCWAIEDSPAGINAACGAGLNVIAITNSVKRDSLQQAAHVIDHMNEIVLL